MEDGIRFAETAQEKEAVFRLRYDIYVKDMGLFGDQADHAKKVLRDSYDDTARSVIAIKEGVALGTMRIYWGGDAPLHPQLRRSYALHKFEGIVSESQICIAERLMVLRRVRGSLLTYNMFVYVYKFLLANGIELVVLDCEPHLINNWLKLGFRPFAPPISYRGVGLVVPMAGIVWDVEQFVKVGSPLLAVVPEDAEAHADTVRRLVEGLPETGPVLSEHVVDPRYFLDNVFSALTAVDERRPLIFDGMCDEDVMRCVKQSHLIKCCKGDVVVKEGNAAQTLFVLLDGEIEIRKHGKPIAVGRPGAVFGEVAFLLGTPRIADVIAANDGTQVLSLSDGAIRRLIQDDAELAAKLLLNLCRCLCARMLD